MIEQSGRGQCDNMVYFAYMVAYCVVYRGKQPC